MSVCWTLSCSDLWQRTLVMTPFTTIMARFMGILIRAVDRDSSAGELCRIARLNLTILGPVVAAYCPHRMRVEKAYGGPFPGLLGFYELNTSSKQGSWFLSPSRSCWISWSSRPRHDYISNHGVSEIHSCATLRTILSELASHGASGECPYRLIPVLVHGVRIMLHRLP